MAIIINLDCTFRTVLIQRARSSFTDDMNFLFFINIKFEHLVNIQKMACAVIDLKQYYEPEN